MHHGALILDVPFPVSSLVNNYRGEGVEISAALIVCVSVVFCGYDDGDRDDVWETT